MDAIVAAAIHDAKNGLTALNTWLAEAQRQTPSPAIAEAQAVATRIGTQLVELLALYRAGEGSLRLAIDDHDLAAFCEDMLEELVLPAASSVRIEAHLDAATQIGAWAFDAYQVKLVLLDALRNGVRHANSLVSLQIALTPTEGLRFEISDDGPGFPDDILSGGETSMDSQSSGLGLRFARLIAQHHATPKGCHGRVELANRKGAVFALTLP